MPSQPPHITTSIRHIVELCRRKRIPVIVEASTGFCARITLGSRQHMLIGADLGINTSAARRVCEDKTFANFFLKSSGIPTVSSQTVTAIEQINSESAEFPLVIKPNQGFGGAGVVCVDSQSQLADALAYTKQFDERVIVSPLIGAREYRLIVYRDTCPIIYQRRSLELVGDGRHTIRQLISTVNQHRRDAGRIDADDPRIGFQLARTGLSVNSVPAAGDRVQPFFNANLKCGGTCSDCSEAAADEYTRLAIKAAGALGLIWAGVDILVDDISTPGGMPIVLEVNANPGFEYYRDHPEHLDRLLSDVLDDLCRSPVPRDHRDP